MQRFVVVKALIRGVEVVAVDLRGSAKATRRVQRHSMDWKARPTTKQVFCPQC